MNTSTIKFCTGVGTVTGANFLFQSPKGTKILIDCGLVQGEKVAEAANREAFSYDIGSINALFITHAHLDHVGRIPKLVKEGFRGPIFSTPQTKALAELVLNDAVNILAAEAKQDGEEPLYFQSDVDAVFSLWKTINYHEVFNLDDEISIYLKDAGHILGSSMVEVRVKKQEGENKEQEGGSDEEGEMRILFTGDLGNSPAPLLRDTEEVGDVDYLVMESVYGDRNHEDREGRINKFKQIIDDTMARGGTLVIPAFSIDRTQTLLFELNNMVETGKIKSVPIFVDSPMAIKATEIYASNTDLFNDRVKKQIQNGDKIFQFPRLEYTMSADESRNIERVKGAKIILAGSGMSIGGRVIGHEARYLPDEKSTILLVGYQTTGSLGRHLADGAKKVHIHGEVVKVKAHIETLYGYSAHKDGDHLLEFVSTASSREKLKQVYVVMGEPGASMHLTQRINDELGVKAIVPVRGDDYELEG
ncbi:MAG: MBL fold metallo-hydrolase [Candidatus Taylorbacteria bacterium]